jgi:adenosyl cobinamide kinase/adenosyl cobinamide phosphate guanylyltransferase
MMTLLLGGVRSGKSSLALQMLAGRQDVAFIATAEALDPDMRQRIEAHRCERPRAWRTIEEPIELEQAVVSLSSRSAVIVDCLTIWLSNLLRAGLTDDAALERSREAAAALTERDSVVVTNEVGMGIVPASQLGRRYRDLLGAVNCIFAEQADRVLLVHAGRALELGRLP